MNHSEEREYGQIRGPVLPHVARAGTFIKSFPLGEFKTMLRYAGETKLAMTQHGVHGELVFTHIAAWRKSRRGDTWQIFLLPGEETE